MTKDGFEHPARILLAVDGSPSSVGAAIVAEAKAWGADRVVVGSHGFGAIGRVLLGSVAAAVATQAPCSVEIARVPHDVTVPA